MISFLFARNDLICYRVNRDTYDDFRMSNLVCRFLADFFAVSLAHSEYESLCIAYSMFVDI